MKRGLKLILAHILLDMWLLTQAGIKVKAY